jgi:hypothetical protein
MADKPIAHDGSIRRTSLSEGYVRKGGQNPPPQNFNRPAPPPAFKPLSGSVSASNSEAPKQPSNSKPKN